MSTRGKFRGRGCGRGRGRGRGRGFSPVDSRKREGDRDDYHGKVSKNEDKRLLSSSKRITKQSLSPEYFKQSLKLESKPTSPREVGNEHSQTASHRDQVASALKEYEKQRLTCSSCGMMFPSREILLDHCKLSKHVPLQTEEEEKKKIEDMQKRGFFKERELMMQRSVERQRARQMENISSDSEKQKLAAMNQGLPQAQNPTSAYKGQSPFYCSLCCADCFNKETYKNHVNGRQHWGNVIALEEELKKRKSSADVRDIFAPGNIRPFYCDVCKIDCQSRSSYGYHLKGKKHGKRLNILAGEKIEDIGDDEEEEEEEDLLLGNEHSSSALKLEKRPQTSKSKGHTSFKDLREKITHRDDYEEEDFDHGISTKISEDVVIKVTSSGHRILGESSRSGLGHRLIKKEKHKEVYSDDETGDLRGVIDKQRSHQGRKNNRDAVRDDLDDETDKPEVDIPDDELYEKYLKEGGTLNRSDFNRILLSIRETGEAEKPLPDEKSRKYDKHEDDWHRKPKDSESYSKHSEEKKYHKSHKSSSDKKYKKNLKKEKSPEKEKRRHDDRESDVKSDSSGKKNKGGNTKTSKVSEKLKQKETEDYSPKISLKKRYEEELGEEDTYWDDKSSEREQRKGDETQQEFKEKEMQFKYDKQTEDANSKPQLNDEEAKQKLFSDIAQISAKYSEGLFSEVERQRLIYRDLVKAYPHLAIPADDGTSSGPASAGEEPSAYELGKPFFSGGWEKPDESALRSPASSHSDWSYEEDCGEDVAHNQRSKKERQFDSKRSPKISLSPERHGSKYSSLDFKDKSSRAQAMASESDSNWPPSTTNEEKRRIRDYERMPDVAKSYHQQEEMLREKFGRRLDETELTALTNINVTIQRSEITTEGVDYGTGATRDYKDSYRKDKYNETRQEQKAEKFPKQLSSSKFDIDKKKIISSSHSRSRSSSKRSSTERRSRRSRSYSTSSGSSRSFSRSRSKSPKGRNHRRNGKSYRYDSEGSKKRYDSKRSRSRSPKSRKRSRSRSRDARSRSR